MGARLTETAQRLGIDPAGQALIVRAFAVAMDLRRTRDIDERAPDHLHPARTALILMDDAAVADPDAIAAALVTETRDRRLEPPAATLRQLGPEVARLAAAVPDPRDEDRLLENLVAAEPRVLVIALGERLDHARHLHLRPASEWERYHRVTCGVYRPVAERAQPIFRRRLDWWCRTFARRLSTGA